MGKGKKKKRGPKAVDPAVPKCTLCGRRITVRKIEDRLYHCSHCQKMFQV
jgi:ribosomal protein L37AE/L43A